MREEMIKVISSIAIFAILNLLHQLVNSRRINRSKQLLLPAVSLVYVVLAVVVLRTRYEDIVRPLETIGRSLRMDHAYIEILYLNALVYAVYVLGRIIPTVISLIAFRKKPIFPELLDKLYVYDETCQQWLLRNKWTNFRNLMKWLMITSVLSTGIIMAFIWNRGPLSPFHAYVFPVIYLIVIAEVYIFLNGLTEFEYAKTVTGDDSYAHKIRNLYILREIYEKIFAHELLTAETKCDYTSMKSVTDYIEQLSDSESETERKIAEFFKLNGESKSYDADYISATLKLLNGTNVVFYDPFYRDLGKYLILPMLYNLLSNKKCLIVTARESVKSDIAAWAHEILVDYGKIDSLWRVRELDHRDPECEVGVLGFAQFYDPESIKANADFLRNVGFVVMVEPSLIVNTGQIGLSILADYMTVDDVTPTYCFLDRITDGLVDSISHVLQINITEVEAPPVSRNIHTSMAWDADGDYLSEKLFDKQTKYMGNGIELAAVAIKNQIPEVEWFSESKVPIKDIKWIAGQYFATICKYMNQPIQQESLYDRVKFISNIWSTTKADYKFLIAEDEFMNMFNTMRMFLSRGDKQTFVNIFSESYLLRDYMRCNPMMFVSNPDAIPSIVPDYAKTERNTLIKMLMLMTTREVHESQLLNEFKLVGIENDDANSILTALLKEYFGIDRTIIRVRSEKQDEEEKSLDEKNLYSITEDSFNRNFKKTLKNAFFICEDEDEIRYIDAKLFGHVTQVVLPGQLVVYDGKSYIVHSISSENGVVLRRASNLYDGRKYYRQIRKYSIDTYGEKQIISSRTVMDVDVTRLKLNFKVSTTGFLEMNKNHDLRTARVVNFANDPNVEEYTREYRNKSVLRIKLPDADENVMFTIAMLLSELMRSVFPSAWPYIAITTKLPENVDGMLNYMLYSLDGKVEEGCIYIIEDSELDLGLIEAIEKNLIKFIEIITDYLYWHFEKMREPAFKDPEPVTPEFPKIDAKRRSLLTDMFRRIGALFGIKKEEVKVDNVAHAETHPVKEEEPKAETKAEPKPQEVVAVPEPAEMPGPEDTSEDEAFSFDTEEEQEPGKEPAKETEVKAEELIRDEVDLAEEWRYSEGEEQPGTEGAEGTAQKNNEGKEADEAKKVRPEDQLEPEEGNPDIVAVDGTDIFDESGTDEDNEYLEECFIERGIGTAEKSRYQKECFLKFGFNEIDKRLQLQDVMKYLTVRGFSQNAFRKARTRNLMEDSLIDLNAVNHCDFCGMPISGVSYERLTDGRIRCNDCTNSAITTVDDFREIFKQCLSLMQSFFAINYSVGMKIVTTDAKTIARGYGSVFKPSTEYASRVLGYARKASGRYEIYLENGSPRLATIDTMVHELTHIWQYINWNEKEIRKLYPDPAVRDMVYEGMACWVSIQYLYLIGENAYARDQEMIMEQRNDIYGAGFKVFREKYPFIKDSSLVKYSPFAQFPPIS